ncbi:cytochrome o ubiquinol oxidase subunit IV [Francisella halioticida]|uniref:Cytochrome bo(3) ubiquinol oxidase subunit 4 n=1 Tax=Francisella halioticida TaxID=549298 RepID=A0ABM6M1E6_9GAMM|nr:cytochrome o ubiquinol oxidase subunit IV [Francisella halioticida]ASG68705.1 cytochrome o ubiquinol oxidase subunit IV [Francisella halioticida]BCD91655.1 cytochrome o ubiquinol oxidase subunit IV [Francisella halioticida]
MAKEHLYDQATGAAYGTYKSYITGFVLSVITTTIAFVLVGFSLLPPIALCVAVAILAIVQLFIQLVYFLHLSTDSKALWNLVSAIFAAIIVVIVVAGTMWIMFDLYDMMM